MCRGRRERILLHQHIQSEGTVLRGSRAGRRFGETLHSPAPSREMAPQQSRPSPSISQTTRCVGGKEVTNGAAHEGWSLDLGTHGV